MALQIYNTLSRQKEEFKPLQPGKIGMYVCGMTVYDFCHMGHARVMVSFDVIVRYLRHKGFDVNYIRNITDIDDKIIQRAAENGEPFEQLVDRMVDAMNEDFAKLNILTPNSEPRATQHIDGIIKMVETLIEKGFAYAAKNGDVYYRVRKFDGYGKLSGKILEELESGARIAVEEEKEDPLDFVLWKSAKPEEPSWDSPWGQGRPGWHIECSVMSTCCLGNNFDIHGGGPDLKFPHHENEIAQSEAATGEHYANTWMHAGALRIDGEKMSKSLGNFFTIRDILEKYDAEVIRFFLSSVQYRSAINYSEDGLKDAEAKLDRLYNAIHGCDLSAVIDEQDAVVQDTRERFEAAMDDDFNTPKAIAVLFDLVNEINKKEGAEKNPLAALLVELSSILGCLQSDPDNYLQRGVTLDDAYIQGKIQERAQAKKDKDFALADKIREDLDAQGIILQDSREGTTWVKK
ncbi:cysteine--tRNA ligase [Bermanella marisrubri]|uniref:Cysteine--tRNA ligase n=1 Tax=Bermanella marisrubri TaxID=207949 RepID=Q1N563_9GAMM|nr:cysteine--tRNA ligase [Bermanella marisrubri]EAT13215.1 cysteinyl-tRNA synthetase [Oceanobacter sp. RED65] [Bermanella marisrubri]QIZ83983.1 cysteine--tRNA ligase [Bermanella marisrubri]